MRSRQACPCGLPVVVVVALLVLRNASAASKLGKVHGRVVASKLPEKKRTCGVLAVYPQQGSLAGRPGSSPR